MVFKGPSSPGLSVIFIYVPIIVTQSGADSWVRQPCLFSFLVLQFLCLQNQPLLQF